MEQRGPGYKEVGLADPRVPLSGLCGLSVEGHLYWRKVHGPGRHGPLAGVAQLAELLLRSGLECAFAGYIWSLDCFHPGPGGK